MLDESALMETGLPWMAPFSAESTDRRMKQSSPDVIITVIGIGAASGHHRSSLTVLTSRPPSPGCTTAGYALPGPALGEMELLFTNEFLIKTKTWLYAMLLPEANPQLR